MNSFELIRAIEGRLLASKQVFEDAVSRIDRAHGDIPETTASLISLLHDISGWTRERIVDVFHVERLMQITQMVDLLEINEAILAALETAKVESLPDLITAIQTLQTDLAFAEWKLEGNLE